MIFLWIVNVVKDDVSQFQKNNQLLPPPYGEITGCVWSVAGWPDLLSGGKHWRRLVFRARARAIPDWRVVNHPATRAEPGCLGLTVRQHPKIANLFAVYEKLRDQAAFDAHLQYAHTKTFVEWIQASGLVLHYERWDEKTQP